MSTHTVVVTLVSQVGVEFDRTITVAATDRADAIDTAMAQAQVYARRTGRAVAYPISIDGEPIDPECLEAA